MITENKSNGKIVAQQLISEQSQRSVLGSALLENKLMRGPLAELAVSDFVGSLDRNAYGIMLEFADGGQPFDAITVSQVLGERGLDEFDAAAYLGDLLDGA